MKEKIFDFECEKNVDDCILNLNKFGICYIKNYLSPEQIRRLRLSFHDVLENNIDATDKKMGHPTNKGGAQAKINLKKAEKNGAEIFSEIAYSELVSDVSKAYFSPNECIVAANVLITHLKSCPSPILPWHYDRLQTLKFWIYLEDADSKDGAFEYCPGSHWEGRYRASYNMAVGKSIDDLPNDIPDYRVLNPITVASKAGDMFIFDPDGFHRGGIVEEGHERKALRIDTYPKGRRKSIDKLLSRGWMLTSRLNIAKLFQTHTYRILGDQTSDLSLNRKEHSINWHIIHSKKKFLKDFSLYSLSSVFDKSLGLVLLPLLSTKLSYDEFGYYSLFIAASSSLSLFVGLGGDKYARLVTIKRDEDYQKAYSILIIYFLLSVSLICLLLNYYNDIFNILNIYQRHINLFVLDAVLIYLISFKLCRYQALRKSFKYAAFNLSKSFLYGIFVFYILLNQTYLLDELIYCKVLSGLATVIVFYAYDYIKLNSIKFDLKLIELNRCSKFIFSALPNTLLLSFYAVYARILISNNSLEILAKFAFTITLISPISIIVEILNKTTLPIVLENYKNDKIKEIDLLNLYLLIFIILISIIYISLILIFGDLLFPKYTDCVKYFAFFIVIPIAKHLYYSTARILTYKEKLIYLNYFNYPLVILYLFVIYLGLFEDYKIYLILFSILQVLQFVFVNYISKKFVKHKLFSFSLFSILISDSKKYIYDVRKQILKNSF